LRDEAREGGIDLLIETPESMLPAEIARCRTHFVSRIYRALDEQRIDIATSDGFALIAHIRRD